MHCQGIYEDFDPSAMTICCTPNAPCHIGEPIYFDRLLDVVKIICNNENCSEGEYMHKPCFDQWEYSVLTFLRSTGRARSWSEKQRLQNLWTKKGYDLAYKACGCKCGKGHLRKDLDWFPPTELLDDASKRKRNRKKKNDKPSLSIMSNPIQILKPVASPSQQVPLCRIRTSSLSSSSTSTSSGSGSPPNFSDLPMSPTASCNGVLVRVNLPSMSKDSPPHASESIFSRRQDFSSFNSLPYNKINSYHIKIEDEGNQGNDEIRCFILSTFSSRKASRTSCIFCGNHMIIFDRYPLIDGTFFVSPRAYSNSSIPVRVNCMIQYLNALCMGCLEGWNTKLQCKFCMTCWNGSDLILGTMYSYDVLAAKPCCESHLKCMNCKQTIFLPEDSMYFSEYSRSMPCPHCSIVNFHFIKPLDTYYLHL